MYWLGFLDNPRQAGELDWKAIGGTWGVATSRLASWESSGDVFLPPSPPGLLGRIGNGGTSGGGLSRYVGKCFEDVWRHIAATSTWMRPDADGTCCARPAGTT